MSKITVELLRHPATAGQRTSQFRAAVRDLEELRTAGMNASWPAAERRRQVTGFTGEGLRGAKPAGFPVFRARIFSLADRPVPTARSPRGGRFNYVLPRILTRNAAAERRKFSRRSIRRLPSCSVPPDSPLCQDVRERY